MEKTAITEATLRSGEKVFVNDYVYVAAPWEKRDPVPYSIGRIIEFLAPDDTSALARGSESGRPKESGLRARMAWFYRPHDVQDKGVGDHRLLLAALFSEIVPFSHVRGKCIVRHRDKIADLNAYKKKDDRFYFHQLFDPFTKDQYEVILSTDIHNLPAHIKDVLVSRYEFVVCEREALPDLQDTLRLCETCGDWCPGPESVMCELCKRHYHMECVNPPLLSKPSRGYGWSCASCNNKRENKDVEVVTSKSRQNKDLALAAAKARAKAKANVKLDEDHERFWKGWNFRYFGQYTVAEDTLDPDDMIYVRAPTRIGPKYQVIPAPIPEGPRADPDLPDRGGESTVEMMSMFVAMSEEDCEKAERRKHVLTARTDLLVNVDWLEEVVRRFSEAWLKKQSVYSVNMRKPLCVRAFSDGKEVRYRDRDWSEFEDAVFDESVRKHHSELRHVRNDIKGRTMPEIVRHFGHWKARQLKLQRLFSPPEPTPVASNDDNTSIYGRSDRRVFTCAVCRTKESESWWRAPRNLFTSSMCDECGILWRKYAIKSARNDKDKEAAPSKAQSQYATPEPPTTRSGAANAKAASYAAERQKREGTPAGGPASKKLRLASGASTPLRLVCSLCRKSGPQGLIVKCGSCGFTIHAGCVGVPPEDATSTWMCEICSNEQSQESNLDPRCALCPPQPADRKKGARDASFLRAAKPTEFRGWVHILCSTYNNQLEYTDARRMKLVEGIVSIPQRNYTQVKPSQRKDFPTVEFRNEVGVMNAVILCDNHGGSPLGSGKKIYDLCDLDERGRTALQVFTETYKQAQNGESTYGLLRKARRLDEIVPAPRFDAVPSLHPSQVLPSENQCVFCLTESSPFWWPTDSPAVDLSQAVLKPKTAGGSATQLQPADTSLPGSQDHPWEPTTSLSLTHKNDVTMGDASNGPVKLETPEKALRVCHTCYFKQLKAKSIPVTVDLTTLIAVS
ncbi:putative PHD type zinc finger protein with BAH domain-containing protein [Serendipita sp. 399]|nr:putative PHD type zinc finger protein with BAH domain-containing protein [Serendipita sp. 399]